MTVQIPAPIIQPAGLGCGPIEALAQQLYDELHMGGYSVLFEDVKKVVIDTTTFYAGWAPLDVQFKRTGPITIDEFIPLSADEWSLILPLCRAHCDLLQARLAEASRSMGVEMFGMSVSEATQIHNQRTDELPRLAFCCAPWTVGED